MILSRLAMVLGLLSPICFSSAFAAGKYPDLEKCYQSYGQVETTEKGGKKVSFYKDQGQVAGECNDKVLARARKEKKVPDVLALAGIIGRNSNWQSAMPVYSVAAKIDAKKAACIDKDPMYALGLALSSPADNDHAIGALAFMNVCWPKNKDALVELLKGDGGTGYAKDHLCKFLTDKKSLPADKQNLCRPS